MLRAREPSIIKFKTLTNNNRQTKLLKKLRRNKNTDNSIKQRGLNLVKQKATELLYKTIAHAHGKRNLLNSNFQQFIAITVNKMQRTRASSNRRQTLGGVSTNHGSARKGHSNNNSSSSSSNNRRQSVDPRSHENHGPPPKSRPPRGRASMIPRVGRENLVPATPPTVAHDPKRRVSTAKSSSGRRRSGMGGGGGGGGDPRRQSLMPPSVPVIVDPRPVTDKLYQQDCIKELFSFLQKSGYEHPISHKGLSRPSGKDFSNIVTFMLRRVDPSFQDGTLKIEDEISMNFKAMGYPFSVSKTALVAAGSPHTWPTLLAALTWLMKRIQCMEYLIPEEEENNSGEFDSVEELESKTDKYFFSYLSASYTAFLKGDEKFREELEMGLADRLEGDDNILMQDIEQMTDQNAAIVEKMNNLSMGEKDLEELVKKRDSYATDLEQFHDLIHQMDQHVATLKNKKNNQSEELEGTSKSLAKIMSKVQILKDSIGNQELSLDDVQKMQNERKGVEEAIERALALRDQRRSALWEIESEVDKSWSDLESFVSDYSSNVGDLKLVPIVSSKGIEMEAVVNKDAVLDPNLSKLLDIDLPGIIEPTLTSCHEEYCSLISDSKWKYQESLDKLERSEEAFTEALERNRIVENKIDKCEETMEAEREAQDAKLGVRVREADSIETKVASLRDPVALEEQMTQFERQCSELEAMRQQHEEDNVARKKAVCEEIDQAIVSMKKYDEFCLEKIKEVQQYRKNKHSKYGKLKRPSTMEPSE